MAEKLKGVQVITPQNVEQIKSQLEDGRYYWATQDKNTELEVMCWNKNRACDTDGFCWDLVINRDSCLYSIDLTPIVHHKPISDEEFENMAKDKYPLGKNDRAIHIRRLSWIEGAKDLRKKIYGE